MPMLESSWVDITAIRTFFKLPGSGLVPSGEEEAKGGSNHCHPPPPGVDEKVEPDSSWRYRARGNRHKSRRGKFWLERKKNAHHGDRETLELVPGEMEGSLLWGVLVAQLDQPSAACFSFSGQPGAEQGLDRRPWARSLLPKAPL